MKLLLMFDYLFVGAAVFAIPNLTRRGALFGLAIPPNFRDSEPGRGP